MQNLSEKEKKLIRLFTMDGRPYLLYWQHRKVSGKKSLKEFMPTIQSLKQKGLVVLHEKTSTKTFYQYTGEPIQ